MDIPEKQTFLKAIPPFDRLPTPQLAQVADALTLRHFSAGQTLIKRWDSPRYFYFMLNGVVEECDPEGVVDSYAARDTFDSRALIEGRSQHRFVAREPCSCYVLPGRLFLTLTRTQGVIQEFYHADLARRLDGLITVQQQREASAFMLARIGDGDVHPPVFVDAKTTLHDAAQAMKTQGTTALLIKRNGEVGIFTARDVREQLLLAGISDSTPVGAMAHYDLVTLEQDDFLFNALVVMTKHAIRHVIITRDGKIMGMLEQKDLLNFLANHSYLIANQIEHAASRDELRQASAQIPRLIRSLYDRGVKPRYIAHLVTDLNRKIFAKLYGQMAGSDVSNKACLIVMGSEGRGEQLLRTDQDNALILEDGVTCDNAILAQKTAAFTAALVELGYPRCPGNIMASNPAWVKPLSAYRDDLRRWIHDPDESAFMNLAIFYDAVAVAGDDSLLAKLKMQSLQLLQDHRLALQHFARATLTFPTPLGLWNQFKLEKNSPHEHALDIKKGAVFPIVHGVRSLALEYGLTETNTIARIQALSGRGPFNERFTADLIEAFDFITMVRLREQLAQGERGEACTNYVMPGHLNKLERNLLKDSLKIVKEFKGYISYHFKLAMVS